MKLFRPMAVAAALALAACSPAKKEAAPAAAGLTPIRFATDWRAEAEHGGFYEALAEGEYAKRGLDVKIVQGGPGVNVPQLLAAGSIDMGVGSNGFVVLNLAQEGVPVKAVAAVFQKDPQVLIAHPDAGVNSLADLKGHPVLLGDAAVSTFWVWLKAKYGLNDDQVRKYTFNNGPFLADKRAVQEGYLTSEPYTIEKQAGMKPKVFLLADNGYPGYATMILAPDALIARNPAAVKAFVEATAKGWNDYLNGDPRPADALIKKDNPEMTQDVLDQARAKLKANGIADGGDAAPGAKGGIGIGTMTDARWQTLFDVASGAGVYPKTLDYKKAYTLQFVAPPAK
ncbi:MAG TPA: ABC transporter substrate-binding protein [Phenylobacterium sp.]|jgi:NitT/TauT family transport system substrate-binding protein|uniref:ABC transporter substrate-binding protein n=1 Tax=Phenylobacterium sp. TaxID=1871053 RepID=UPI002CE55DD3|nr:ABC transporter substrate-binding protein [Phenylobacterium sp.]HXA37433.1 ABC transporter substrate-binding protein [Phenylobacterium sp.]